jgi:ABC-type Na+ transport system ATPase subunit NatA
VGLVVEHINKSFAQFKVIKDLSMEVKEGAIFGFLGANGAGKTTTMRMILDILRPDSGRITWGGKDVRDVPRRNWGYLPEERGLYPKMRVEEQLLFLARLNGLSKQAARKELDEWLERFQINTNRKKKIEELSKGNQQKVQFLGALVKRQDEVQNAVAPLTWLFAIGYIVSFFGIYTPDATWMKVISYVPFWTPTTMLVRIGVNGVAGWEIAMTIALMIVAIFACAWISARIYRFGVLMYGQRPGLGQLARLVRMK